MSSLDPTGNFDCKTPVNFLLAASKCGQSSLVITPCAIGGGLDYKIVKAWPRVYRSTYFRPGSTAEIKTTSGPLAAL